MKIKFSHIILILALLVAGCAAYFSVWGLSQLFSGASMSVIIMASVLEFSKIASTTALHNYWNKLNKSLKYYLVIAVAVLMLITSAGIYGFLSNAYQKTASQLEIEKGEVGILDNKKTLFQKNIDDNQRIVDTKNRRIEQLTNLRNTQEVRLDSARSNTAKDKVRKDIQIATEEIQKLTNDIDGLNNKNVGLSDSISNYTVKTLEISANSSVGAEVGPLKYISEVTGVPMNKVVNILILLFIFVFDPLAIALVLLTNRIFEIENEQKTIETKVETTKKETNVEYKPLVEEPSIVDEQYDDIHMVEPIVEDKKLEEDVIEETIFEEAVDVVEEENDDSIKLREPVVPNGKITVEDIKEVKDRGFSINIPKQNSNTIQRIGSQKIVKDGDNNKVFFKRD
jgi:hypothetical protein